MKRICDVPEQRMSDISSFLISFIMYIIRMPVILSKSQYDIELKIDFVSEMCFRLWCFKQRAVKTNLV